MKFSCDKYQLLSALTISSRAAVSKSPIPLLDGLLLETSENELKITGYDLKTGIVTTVPAEVEKSGGIVINARLLCDVVRKMPGQDVNIDVSQNYVAEISSEQSILEILGSPTTDFPELPIVEEKEKLEIKQAVLKKMISQTNFAVSDNESRPIQTGALFETEDGELTIVAVDGYRLALRREPLENDDVADMSFVVPGTALDEVERILSEEDKNALILLDQKHVIFKIEETTLISRRLEGEFINYKGAVPDQTKYRIKIYKEDLLLSLDRVSTIITEKQKRPVRCVFEDDIVKLYSATSLGKASDECRAEGDGESLEIGFNNRYFIDALKAAPADEVILELISGVSPCVISPCDESNTFLYMILPVRLRAES